MKKSLLMGGAIAAIAIVITAIVLSGVIEQEEELALSNYPTLFEKDVVIVIGENATQIEYEGAEAIAENLHSITGNMPVIKSDTELTEGDKAKYNLILVGGPRTNRVLEEVYEMTNATWVTGEYPGENKGILEILRNPWNEEKAILLVEGSDEWGVKAASMKLVKEGQILQGKTIVTEKIETALIELTGCVEPSPKYVTLPVTLPVDTREEALIIAKACGEDLIIDRYTKILQTKNGWCIGRVTPNFPDFEITINKTTGKTECIFYG